MKTRDWLLITFAIASIVLGVSIVSAQNVQLSEYNTNFKVVGEDHPRSENVKLAASKISGVVLQPGEVFSYNQTVGERSAANGFKKAHVIKNKMLVDDWGGGACQVASTLHAAVISAGLKIVDSRPHSLASAYMQPGMDSTVAWPDVDFKFQNDTDNPIQIFASTSISDEQIGTGKKAKIKKKGTLSVTLLSSAPLDREVELKFKSSKPVRRQVWRIKSASVKSGSVVKQAGMNGMTVERTYIVRKKSTGETLVQKKHIFKFAPLVRIVYVPKDPPAPHVSAVVKFVGVN